MAPPRLAFTEASLRTLDERPGDLLVLTSLSDERPLASMAGLVDWRLRGAISRWVLGGFATRTFGERVLYPTGRRLSHPALLLLGLGSLASLRTDRVMALVDAAVAIAHGLQARTITCDLFGLDRLASPLRHTGVQLLERFGAAETLDAVTLVVEDAEGRADLEELLSLEA